jgi:hypothetical protein
MPVIWEGSRKAREPFNFNPSYNERSAWTESVSQNGGSGRFTGATLGATLKYKK